MFLPNGFSQRSIVTSLGRMVYYTAERSPLKMEEQTDLPPLVFLHGFGGGSSSYEWSKVYPAFVADYRILAPDLIGWGRSEHPAKNYKIEDYLTTITEFLEQTCSTPATVIASSLTAAFTIRVAIQRPDLFKSLIVVNPSGLLDFGEDNGRSLFAQIAKIPILDRLLYSTGIANQAGIQSFLETRQFAKSDRIYPEIVEAYYQSATQPNAEYAALSFVGGDLWFDLSLYISQLTTATAIIWGEEASFTSPETGQRLANLNPSAIKVFELLKDVGLTPHLELPAVTIGIIRQLINVLETPSTEPVQ